MKPVAHLLLIGGWTQTLQKALDNGFRVSYFGPVQPNATFDPAILARCAHVRMVEVDRIGICLALAQELHTADPLDACLSYTERGMETAAVLATALGVRGMAPWPVAATRYKDWMRQLLDAHPGLALPWRRVDTPGKLCEFHREHGPDIIVKPLSGAGGVGVQRLHSTAQLEAYIHANAPAWPTDLLAEEFIASDDLYSVETLTIDGRHHVLGMSFSKMTGYPYACQSFVIMPPPGMPDALRADIADCVTRFLDAMRLDWGVAHTEVKIREDGRPAGHHRVANSRRRRPDLAHAGTDHRLSPDRRDDALHHRACGGAQPAGNHSHGNFPGTVPPHGARAMGVWARLPGQNSRGA